MKKIYSLLTGLLLTAIVFFTQQANAQAPQKMSYQSVHNGAVIQQQYQEQMAQLLAKVIKTPSIL